AVQVRFLAYQRVNVLARDQGVLRPVLDAVAQAFGVALVLHHVGAPAHRIADHSGQRFLLRRSLSTPQRREQDGHRQKARCLDTEHRSHRTFSFQFIAGHYFPAARRVPRRRARSFISAKKTGTRMSTWMVEVTMPPTVGAAIGFITSLPIPDSQRMGTRLASTTHTVISLGRSRCTAPSMTAASTSSCRSGTPVASRRSRASCR